MNVRTMTVLSFVCPTCDAPVGHLCRARVGYNPRTLSPYQIQAGREHMKRKKVFQDEYRRRTQG